MRNKPMLGLTLGEATGIGPELVVKALQSEEIRSLATWVIIGDERVLQQGERTAGLSVDYSTLTSIEEIQQAQAEMQNHQKQDHQVWLIDLQNLSPDSYQFGSISVDSGKVTGETLAYALQVAQDQGLDGVVYAPLNKEALHQGGHDFKDEIHFFADVLQVEEGFREINVMDQLWFTRVTSHIPLSEVSTHITTENVLAVIQFAHQTLIQAGRSQPKIAVAALNPHAGDGGLMGHEEIEHIIPAVEKAQQEGIHVQGPFPSDTIFLRLRENEFDCMVSMYHDQGQIGMKLLGFQKGVTISAGLPVVLTTPAHGTAFDIAGTGVADPGAMLQAMRMSVQLSSFARKEQKT